MTKEREALKLAMKAMEITGGFDVEINAIKEALAEQYSKDKEQAKTDSFVRQLDEALAQPKYRRGDRLICLETEEYCVIHISGTDRQWVKFPDSYIGVYTNEQVAELFELLPKEPEPWEKFCDSNCVWTDHHPDCKLAERLPLTDEEIKMMILKGDEWKYGVGFSEAISFARVIEAAHGIKGLV